jgi:hypothetical protein
MDVVHDAADADLDYIVIEDVRFEILYTAEAKAISQDGHELLTIAHVCRPTPNRTITVLARYGLQPHVLDVFVDDPSGMDDEQMAVDVLSVFATADPWPTPEEFEDWLAEITKLNGGSQLQ